MTRTHAFLCAATGATVLIGAGCASSYTPRTQAAGTELTTHALNVQEVERMGADLAESLLQSGYFRADGEKAIVAVNQFINNTSQTSIDRSRVTNRIFMQLVNSGLAEAYSPNDFSVEQFSGRLHNKRVFTLNTRIYEDIVRQDRNRQVSYIFQMQLLEHRGDSRPQVWIDERRITTESRS